MTNNSPPATHHPHQFGAGLPTSPTHHSPTLHSLRRKANSRAALIVLLPTPPIEALSRAANPSRPKTKSALPPCATFSRTSHPTHLSLYKHTPCISTGPPTSLNPEP